MSIRLIELLVYGYKSYMTISILSMIGEVKRFTIYIYIYIHLIQYLLQLLL